MHPSSPENMRACYERHIAGPFIDDRDRLGVLDIGAQDVNGGYREIFGDERIDYTAADMTAGDGVDLVFDDPYWIPLADASVDVVISAGMLQHCEFFWRAFDEMMRILKPDGYLFLVAPSTGRVHGNSVDCYRFYPDAYRALARHADCHLVEMWRDERGPWRDLVGVFTGRWFDQLPSTPDDRKADRQFQRGARQPATVSALWRCHGEAAYLDVLRAIHRQLRPARYFEIGVEHGASLSLATAEAQGVDPEPSVNRPLSAETDVIELTSDNYFAEERENPGEAPPDLVFIDGEHRFQTVLRDFANVEAHSASHSLVVIDDVFPHNPRQAGEEQNPGLWTGDVWKLLVTLQAERPDLLLVPLDTWPTGLLLVIGLDRAKAFSSEALAEIIATHGNPGAPPPPRVLRREGSYSPSDSRLGDLYRLLREARGGGEPADEIARRAKELFEGAVERREPDRSDDAA